MPKTLRAIIHEGKIEPLEQLDLPEGSKVLVTLLPDNEAEFWLQASQASLDTIWDNPEDDVYGQLLRPCYSSLMTKLLEKAFEEAAKLPEDAQDSLAKFLMEELASERRWDQLFGESADVLSELADEALAEHAAGRTTELDPDKL